MRTGKFAGKNGKSEFDGVLASVYPNSCSSVNSTFGFHEEVFEVDGQNYVATVPQTLVAGPDGEDDLFFATIDEISPEKARKLIYG